MLKARTTDEQAQRIARLIHRNAAALSAKRISFETFSARQQRLWRKADQGRGLIVGGTRVHERLSALTTRYVMNPGALLCR